MPTELPKFIIGDDGGERDFVVHLHYPRIVIEFTEGRGTPTFLDSQDNFITLELAAGRESAQTLARLLREAGDFFMDQSA